MEFLQPLLGSSLVNIFLALALGMTTRARQLNSTIQATAPLEEWGPIRGVGSANGTAFSIQTQVRVRWGWIALPATLLLLTVMVLMKTILETKGRGLEVWKQSLTALVCSGLDESTQSRIRAVRDPILMEEVASEILVRVEKQEAEKGGEEWRLESVKTLP